MRCWNSEVRKTWTIALNEWWYSWGSLECQNMLEWYRTCMRKHGSSAKGETKEFHVEVGLHQGSGLGPIMFSWWQKDWQTRSDWGLHGPWCLLMTLWSVVRWEWEESERERGGDLRTGEKKNQPQEDRKHEWRWKRIRKNKEQVDGWTSLIPRRDIEEDEKMASLIERERIWANLYAAESMAHQQFRILILTLKNKLFYLFLWTTEKQNREVRFFLIDQVMS